MRSFIALCVLLVLVAVPPSAHARDTIVVMTQNQYLGADLTPIGDAFQGSGDINQAVRDFLDQVEATNFRERAKALAEEIADRQPDVVGLQEVFSFTLNGKNGAPPYIDHLDYTRQALEALGEHYTVVASVLNTPLTIPVDFNGDLQPDAEVGVIDRDVLLVREGIPASTVPFSQFCGRPSQGAGLGCNYQAGLPIPNTPVEIVRGFAGVDVTIGNRTYRVVNTHLEVKDAAPIQAAQAAELIGTLQATTPRGRSVIVLGDMNSSPVDVFPFLTPYQLFTQPIPSPRGRPLFFDTWELRPGNPPEFTCCQAANLLNHQSELSERIDMIFSNYLPRKVKARLVGNRVSDKTRPDRLWPSDHAGVVAELTFD